MNHPAICLLNIQVHVCCQCTFVHCLTFGSFTQFCCRFKMQRNQLNVFRLNCWLFPREYFHAILKKRENAKEDMKFNNYCFFSQRIITLALTFDIFLYFHIIHQLLNLICTRESFNIRLPVRKTI